MVTGASTVEGVLALANATAERRRRALEARARTVTSPLAARLAKRSEEIQRLVQERMQRFRGGEDARERALMSLYADDLLTESEVRHTVGWTHWDFLGMLGKYRDLVPPDENLSTALDALEQR